MKSWKLLTVLISCIVLIVGCGKNSTQTDGVGKPEDDNASEISVEVCDSTNFYVNAALKFEEETGIKVNVTNYYESEINSGDESTVRNERIQAELMAGKGSDIYAGMYLDFKALGQNQHLCNIANWISTDSEFSEDKYYMNILKSSFDDGNLYSIPLFMMFSVLGTTIEISDLDEQSLDWEEFFELTRGIKRNGVLYGITDYMLFIRRFRDRYDYFIDEENKKHKLDSPEMVKLLEQCKEWSLEGICIRYDAENYMEIWENAFFKEYGGSGMYMLTNFRYDNPYLTEQLYHYDIPTDTEIKDKANKISPIELICINAASQYKGTAWNFVKFLLREDVQITGQFTPINQKAAAEHDGKVLKELTESFGLKINPDDIIEESKTILQAIEKVPYTLYQTDIEKIVFKDEARRFFNNEISADEAAKNMVDRVELYFKEQ